MKCCSKCFKKVCRCGRDKIEIDYYIYPAIYELNRKGYKTSMCCSGHEYDTHLSTYIIFYEDVDANIDSEYFQFESYNYRGFHERKNCIRVKPEIAKKFKKKRTNKLVLVQKINEDLYKWAQSLSPKNNPKDREIDFSTSYFEKEIEKDEIVDVQKPWILFTKAVKNNNHIVEDFFSEIERADDLTEIIVNSSGHIKRFNDNDFISNRKNLDRSSLLKSKVEFDVSGDYKYLLFGYESYMMIEKIFVENSVWYLSYARTDMAIKYGDGEEHFNIEEFIDEDDMDDYIDEDYCSPVINSSMVKNRNHMEPLIDEDTKFVLYCSSIT